ncbi:MAG: ankyrin repeat domain-containing protein [Parachlamydiaceae bacterium]|nr:ankyrin repeat domain-containing protein [Parachlamydiaceae bacterium]
MSITLNSFTQACNGVFNVFRDISNQLIMKIQNIKNRVLQAYYEPSKQIPKLTLSPHPVPNTYPKQHKKIDWPKYLDKVRHGSDANSTDLDNIADKVEPLEKVTPLHAITLGNNQKGALRLIADGGNVEAKDIRGQTPVYWAAYHGNLEMLTNFKIYGAKLDEKDFRGKTPLRASVKYGHLNVITFLASQKVDLNELDGRGLTALHLAAYRGKFSVYEKLIYCGADSSIKDPLGRTADEILKMKYAEMYHNKWFIVRLFSSPTPPPLSFGSWKIENLASKTKDN